MSDELTDIPNYHCKPDSKLKEQAGGGEQGLKTLPAITRITELIQAKWDWLHSLPENHSIRTSIQIRDIDAIWDAAWNAAVGYTRAEQDAEIEKLQKALNAVEYPSCFKCGAEKSPCVCEQEGEPLIKGQEPLFSCVQCREDQSWPADNLRIYENELWCQECFEHNEVNADVDWHSLSEFEPEADRHIRLLKQGMVSLVEVHNAEIEMLKGELADIEILRDANDKFARTHLELHSEITKLKAEADAMKVEIGISNEIAEKQRVIIANMEAEIERLRERDRNTKAFVKRQNGDMAKLSERLHAATAEADALREALRQGKAACDIIDVRSGFIHDVMCASVGSYDRCNCGIRDLKEALAKAGATSEV